MSCGGICEMAPTVFSDVDSIHMNGNTMKTAPAISSRYINTLSKG